MSAGFTHLMRDYLFAADTMGLIQFYKVSSRKKWHLGNWCVTVIQWHQNWYQSKACNACNFLL